MEKGDVLAKEYKIAVRQEKQVLNIYCKTQWPLLIIMYWIFQNWKSVD
jgi:hypothetical protein